MYMKPAAKGSCVQQQEAWRGRWSRVVPLAAQRQQRLVVVEVVSSMRCSSRSGGSVPLARKASSAYRPAGSSLHSSHGGSNTHSSSSSTCCAAAPKSSSSTSSSDPNDSMTPEEEEAYREIISSRQEKRKAEITEYKRRANFDPLARRAKMAALKAAEDGVGAEEEQEEESPPPPQLPPPRKLFPGSTAVSKQPSGKAVPLPKAPARPQSMRPPPPQQQQQHDEVEDEDAMDDDDDDEDELGEAEFEAAVERFLKEEQDEERQLRRASGAAAAPAAAPPQQGQPPVPRGPRTMLAPGAYKPGALGSKLRPISPTAATAARKTAPAPAPVAAAPPAPAPARPSPTPSTSSPAPRAAATPQPPAPSPSSSQPRPTAPPPPSTSAKTPPPAPGGLAAGNLEGLKELDAGLEGLDAGLDWDTLIAGESFEKYLEKLQKEEEDAEVRRQRSRRPAAPLPTSASDAEEMQLEALMKLLDLVEGPDEGQDNLLGGRRGSSPASTSSTSTTTGFARSQAQGKGGREMEDDIDWSSLEDMFLGKDWDREIREMAVKASEGEEEDGDGPGAAGSPDDAETPLWADEVTTLLLGLVTLSHERYLDKPIFDTAVPEEERAQAFWDAPFALLVLDDSKEAMLEYANKKALDMLGHDFVDIYDLSSFDVVDDEEGQQQEWMWTTTEVEEKLGKHVVVPSLKLRAADGGRVVARDAVVLRVDNLQGDAMGQAVLIRDWSKA